MAKDCKHKNTSTSVRHESGRSLKKCKDCGTTIYEGYYTGTIKFSGR